jgi:ankyrin repeat protein
VQAAARDKQQGKLALHWAAQSNCAPAVAALLEVAATAAGKADAPAPAEVKTSPGGHQLRPFMVPAASFICDGCDGRLREGATAYGDNADDFDLCERCFAAPAEATSTPQCARAAHEDRTGRLPLHLTAVTGACASKGTLLEGDAGGQLFAAEQESQMLPLHVAASAGRSKAVLLMLHMDPRQLVAIDAGERTPLHWAAKTGCDDMLGTMLVSLPQAEQRVWAAKTHTETHATVALADGDGNTQLALEAGLGLGHIVALRYCSSNQHQIHSENRHFFSF